MSDKQKALDKAVLGLFRGDDSGITQPSTFLTTLYCGLKFSWDTTIPTACTNGLKLMINPDWFQTLSAPMRVTLLAHELWHVAFMHMTRVGDRNFKIWNMAADFAINLMLEDNGYTFDIDPLTGRKMGLIDEQYRDMSAEEIYEKLIDGATKVELPFGEDFSADGEPGDDMPTPLTAEEESAIMATVTRANTLSQMNAKEAGSLPGNFSEMMDKLLNPKVRWESLLQRWLTERSDEGYNWRKPNRRYQDIYLPSRGGQEGLEHLLWALDVSGSVTQSQLRIFNSELKGAKDTHSPERMTVATFDHMLQKTWEFTGEDEIEGLHITGRGGTCLDELFDLARREHPTAMVIFSDMKCDIPDAIPGIPVLWLCYDNDSWSPPYGDVIHVDSTPTIPA